MNQHFDLLTPYELRQRAEVFLSFVEFLCRNVLSHVWFIRRPTEGCDTQRLDKVVDGLRW
jgi:hypothetical protein